MTVRQGEVYDWRPPAGPRRVVVLSVDPYNAHGAWPVCAVIVRTGVPSVWLVPVVDADPTGGLVALGTLGPLDPAELSAEPVGMVTGQTWARVAAGLRALFGGPP